MVKHAKSAERSASRFPFALFIGVFIGATAGAILGQVWILFTENRFFTVSSIEWVLIAVGAAAGALIGAGMIALAIMLLTK